MSLLSQIPLVPGKKGWPWTEEFTPAKYLDSHYPKITIVTPSFNQGIYIEETIRSVLLQNYPNLEYIIIDGGSKDDTVEIIKKYQPWISYWISEPDKGQSDAINKGLKITTGEIFNWLNSDDYYSKGALLEVAKGFEKKEVNVGCFKSRLFTTQTEQFSDGTDIYDENVSKTIGWARIDQPCTFFRKTVLDRIGHINSSFHYVMDRELWIRYLMMYRLEGIVKKQTIVVNFRLHDQSKTISLSPKFNKETDLLFYTLFKIHSPEQYAQFLLNTCQSDITLEETTLSYPADMVRNVDMNEVFAYYRLLRGMECYEEGNRELCIQMLEEIDPVLLEPKDRRLLRNTKLKARIVPHAMKKLIRALRNISLITYLL